MRIRSISQFILVTFAALVVCSVAVAFPKPASVPFRWELIYQPGDLRLYIDDLSGEAYWHYTYMVINRTGRDQVWAPEHILFTDGGAIAPSGQDVPIRVTRQLLQLHGNPLLRDQNHTIGTLRQGPENALEGLAVWPARDLSVNEISLFISGISGETARVENPVTGEQHILRKTMQRDYLIPGSAAARGSDPVNMISEQWVMR